MTYDLAQLIFKFSHNKIFTNDRISKFNQDVDRTCYFCLKEGLSPPPSVSVQHTSYYCLMASKYIGAYQSICNINVSEKDFIFGFEGTSEKVLMINIDFFILKFIINMLRLSNTTGQSPPANVFLSGLLQRKIEKYFQKVPCSKRENRKIFVW